ncbi:MAG: hypothetical protein JWM77_1553 [Rhodospirillales bacterium]|nr:hypothetical protein [Rhodospirillales bacterium]
MRTIQLGAIALVLLCTGANAAPRYDQRVVFGDSLSDTGNVSAMTGGAIPPSPPYYNGHYSNGPMWVDREIPRLTLWSDLLLGRARSGPIDGYNFAFGGSTSGPETLNVAAGQVPGALAQVSAYLGYLQTGSIQRPTASTLFTVWTGANDYTAFLVGASTAPTVPAVVARAVGNIESSVRQLYAAGARNFVVVNEFDLALVPSIRGLGAQTAATGAELSRQHNALLLQTVDQLRPQLAGATLVHVDVGGLYADLFTHPAVYGFTNVLTPCLLGSGSPSGACATQQQADQTMFWDVNHPTRATHALIDALMTGSLSTMLDGGRRIAAQVAFARDMSDLVARSLVESAGQQLRITRDGARLGLVMSGVGQNSSFNEQAGVAGFHDQAAFALVGLTYQLTEELRLEADVGYGGGRATLEQGAGGAEARRVLIAAAASYENGGWSARVTAGTGWDRYRALERNADFAPFPTARGSSNGDSWFVAARGGYGWKFGAITAGPELGLRHVSASIDSYAESGTRLLDLRVDEQHARATVGELGLRASGTVTTALGRFAPDLHARYEAQFGGTSTVTARLANGEATSGVLQVGDRNRIRLGAGATLRAGDDVDLRLGYDQLVADRTTRAHSLDLRLRIGF